MNAAENADALQPFAWPTPASSAVLDALVSEARAQYNIASSAVRHAEYRLHVLEELLQRAVVSGR